MAFGSSPDEPLSCQANPKNTRPNRVKEVCQACVWLMEKSPLSFLKNRDKCFHQLVSGKPIPASRSISQHSFASFAPPLSSSSFFLLFFFFSLPSVRATSQGDEQHLCKRDPNNGGDDQGRRNRRSQRVSLCRGRRRRGKVDFW